MAEHPVVLIPQDTTVFNFSNQHQREDAGPTTKDSARGIYLHCAIAVTPSKICLGAVSVKQWYREELKNLARRERTKKDYALPIEEKESYRWLENYIIASKYAVLLPNTLVVSIADREGDIYNIYKEATKVFSGTGRGKAHYLIRAKTNRKVCDENGGGNNEKIKSTLQKEKPLGQVTINVSETRKRKAREAHMTVYSKEIYIALPDKTNSSNGSFMH